MIRAVQAALEVTSWLFFWLFSGRFSRTYIADAATVEAALGVTDRPGPPFCRGMSFNVNCALKWPAMRALLSTSSFPRPPLPCPPGPNKLRNKTARHARPPFDISLAPALPSPPLSPRPSPQDLPAITPRVLEFAKDKILMGAERRSAVLTDESKKLTARARPPVLYPLLPPCFTSSCSLDQSPAPFKF